MGKTRAEWDEILVSKDVATRLETLQEEGRIRALSPDLQALVGFGGGDSGHKDLWDHTKLVVSQTIPQPVLRWAALFHDVAKPVCFGRNNQGQISFHGHEIRGSKMFRKVARAKEGFFTQSEVDEISFIIYHLGHIEAYHSGWTDSAVRRCGKALGKHLDAVFSVARADCTTKHRHKRQKQLRRTRELRTRIEELRALDAVPPALPKGLGSHIAAHLKLQPGPELGRIMMGLKDRVEAGELLRNAPPSYYLKELGVEREILRELTKEAQKLKLY
jgi:poly(A) polymerase